MEEGREQQLEVQSEAQVDPVTALMRTRLPEAQPIEGLQGGWVGFQIPPERVVDICRFLKDEPRTACNYLSNITGTDFKDYMQVAYHLVGLETGVKVFLKTDIPRENPEIDSVTGVWPGADWHERENYDMLGIRFRGHPDLRRILTWEGYEGYPLRKDFVDERPKRERKVRVV